MPGKLLGCFYLEPDGGYDKLKGKFSHNLKDKVYEEKCTLKPESEKNDKFIGTYNSTWKDDNGKWDATLNISYRDKKSNISSLEWEIDGKVIFYGRGMLYKNMNLKHEILIGNYEMVGC